VLSLAYVTGQSDGEVYTLKTDTSCSSQTVLGLVKSPCYKPEGHGINFRLSHWILIFPEALQPHWDPEVDSASNRNE
jgi:hypothetical protein